MHRPVRTVAPETTPVSLSDLKAHCRVDGDDSDLVLTGYLAGAVDHLDGWTGILGRCLVTQSWRQDYDQFMPIMRLPLGPVASVTSVTWRNSAGQLATVASDDYALQADDLGAYVRFKNGFIAPGDLYLTRAVSVTFVAGTPAEQVPAAIKVAIMLLVSHWNENREAVAERVMSEMPVGASALLAPYRRIRI
jgi:uncharacterized phiE125 gp8 family phage protein